MVLMPPAQPHASWRRRLRAPPRQRAIFGELVPAQLKLVWSSRFSSTLSGMIGARV